jgi:hypothetical protein
VIATLSVARRWHQDRHQIERFGMPTGLRPLGREDSNLRSRDQNPLPYRLATPHSRPSLERGYRLERSPNSSITMTAITTAATITIANTVTVMKSGMTATMACENARMKAAFLIAGLVSCVR